MCRKKNGSLIEKNKISQLGRNCWYRKGSLSGLVSLHSNQKLDYDCSKNNWNEEGMPEPGKNCGNFFLSSIIQTSNTYVVFILVIQMSLI